MARHAVPLRERVVGEALALVRERGIAALSIRDVARRLRVSHQAPYTLFPTRDHLVAELAGRAFRAFAAYLDARPQRADAMADMRALGERYLGYAADFPLEYALMFATVLPDPEAHPAMMLDARHAFDVLRDCVAREAASRGEAPDAGRIDAGALFVWTSMHGLASALSSQAGRALALAPGVLENARDETCRRIELALRADATISERDGTT